MQNGAEFGAKSVLHHGAKSVLHHGRNQHVSTPEHHLNTFSHKLGANTPRNIRKMVIFWDFLKNFGAKYGCKKKHIAKKNTLLMCFFLRLNLSTDFFLDL